MAFDGTHYNDASLGYPNLHHPSAPLIGPALGGALRQAYLYARHHGRMLIDQNYGMTFRNPPWVRDNTLSFETALTRIAAARKFIPLGINVLVCDVQFRITHVANNVSAYHRIVLEIEGGASDVGATIETQIPLDSEARMARTAGDISAYALNLYSPFGGSDSYTARIEVAMVNVAAGAVRHIYVDGNAEDRGTGVAAAYQRQSVAVWGEVRD